MNNAMETRYGNVRRWPSQGSESSEDAFIDVPETRHRAHRAAPGDNDRIVDDVNREHDREEELEDDESENELGSSIDGSVERSKSQPHTVERMKWWKVYALHFLFTWNTRTYEYASIVLVSLAFPKTLFATSIRGITSTVSAMLCAAAVGSWIDRAPSRLPPLLIMISSNHGAIVIAYFCWLIWPFIAGSGDDDVSNTHRNPMSSLSKGFLFGFILLLDVVQDISAIGNRLSVERDWVPILVGPITSDTTYGLTQINSVMRRIDLICKLVAPSLLPVMISLFDSRTVWILLLIVVTVVLWTLELWCAHIIARDNPQLRLPKAVSHDQATLEDHDVEERYNEIKPGLGTWPRRLYFVLYQDPSVRFRHYFSMSVWPASISISILQMTVLAYSATMITYLLEVGFSLPAVTIARASGAIVALAATFITPLAVQYLRRRYSHSHERSTQRNKKEGFEGRVVRTVGLWGVSSQFIFMIPVVLVLWNLSPKSTTTTAPPRNLSSDNPTPQTPHLLISIILFSFLSVTRIGHWMYDLMIQELEQVEIPSSQRSTFAGTEQSFRAFFELCHWAATVYWNRPEDFRWLALGSLVVLGIGASIFAAWRRRANGGGNDRRYEELPLDDVG